MFYLTPPRHISTLHETDMTSHAGNVRSSGVKRTSRLCPGKAARSGQLFAQLGVGGPQFAIADPRSASSTRNGRIAAARPDRVIDFFILTKLKETSSMISLRRRDDLPARARWRIVRALAQCSSGLLATCSRKSGVHRDAATWAFRWHGRYMASSGLPRRKIMRGLKPP